MSTRLQLSILMLLLAVCGVGQLAAQTTLSIVDALPPYDLTATLLANGHFSLSTNYTGTSKTIIYREDGSGSRPVNYTSHIHFNVDDIIFQLPFELNPVTRVGPPDHPMTITQLFRDTLLGRPRINARMFGVMPDGDTLRFVFSMEPVKRPSGGFIRLSALVQNVSGKSHSIGTLMLIDTKIGDNDQAPIITAFGYSNSETDFSRTAPPFMPDFWLAIEGTPVGPGLTARGNLSGSDLITPDYFIFGNWVDYTAQGIRGLASLLWRDRTASGLLYTDSAVLLLWDEVNISAGVQRLLAATEIGIVDSMHVTEGTGGGFGFGLAGGGGGIGGGAGCINVDTVHEVPCGAPGYHPYSPDTLQTLYLVTNTGTIAASNVRVVIPQVPAGLSITPTVNPVVPNAIAPTITGVATISLYAAPRLQSQSYTVPIAVMSDADTVVRDELHVCVPGLLGELTVRNAAFLPVCPNLPDTIEVDLNLKGVRCLPISSLELLGSPTDLAQFSLVTPLPTMVPANGTIKVRVHYQPIAAGPIQTVRLAASVRDFESLAPGDTTFAFVRDTADVTGIGKDAEFAFAQTTDTLDFGKICIGDTSVFDWDIRNIGGCLLDITTYRVESVMPGDYSVATGAIPTSIVRGGLSPLPIQFTPNSAGTHLGLLILESDAFPFLDTLVLRGIGDSPRYEFVSRDVVFDTICPGASHAMPLLLTNPTACPVLIDTIIAPGNGFAVLPNSRFTIPPFSSVNVQVGALFNTPGGYGGQIDILSLEAGDNNVTVSAVVANRELQSAPQVTFGDVRVRRNTRLPLVINSIGGAGVEISRIYVSGSNASEFTLILPLGITLPLYLSPGQSLNAEVEFAPSDIEARRALVVVEATPGKACVIPDPIVLDGRGVLPIIDVPRRSVDFGRVCVGDSVDSKLMVRNVGNAVLTIDGLQTNGMADITVTEAAPVIIAAGEQRELQVRFAPAVIGDIVTDLHISSDGDWFTAPDTVLRLSGAGVLCGTLSVDTVYALVGTIVDVPVRITPRAGLTLSAANLSTLLNSTSHRSFQLNVANGERNVRFQPTLGAGSMVSGLTPATSVAVVPTGITIANTTAGTGFNTSDIFAVLRADVLLGDGFRSDLPLTVNDFLEGYSNLEIRNGLLIAEYCAIDRRYVNVSGIQTFLRPSRQPVSPGGVVEFYLPEATHARLLLIDALGREFITLFDGESDRGLHAAMIPAVGVASGVYTVVLETVTGRVVMPLVVAR